MEQATATASNDVQCEEWGSNDVFAQVIGEDKGSYVRGIGLGPSAKDIWGGKDTVFKLRKQGSKAEKYWQQAIEAVNIKINMVNDRLDAMCDLMASKLGVDETGKDMSFKCKVMFYISF